MIRRRPERPAAGPARPRPAPGQRRRVRVRPARCPRRRRPRERPAGCRDRTRRWHARGCRGPRARRGRRPRGASAQVPGVSCRGEVECDAGRTHLDQTHLRTGPAAFQHGQSEQPVGRLEGPQCGRAVEALPAGWRVSTARSDGKSEESSGSTKCGVRKRRRERRARAAQASEPRPRTRSSGRWSGRRGRSRAAVCAARCARSGARHRGGARCRQPSRRWSGSTRRSEGDTARPRLSAARVVHCAPSPSCA